MATELTDIIGPVLPPGEPELRAVAISSLTGSVTLDGVSGGLGNELDRELLLSLRDWADVVLVGARTVVAENYAGTRASCLAVVSRTLRLGDRPLDDTIILTPRSSLADAPTDLSPAELVPADSPEEMIRALHDRGLKRIACEGGPGVFDMMFGADLVDVLHLTVAPLISAPVEQHLVNGVNRWVSLEHHSATDDGTLFLRYRRSARELR